MFRRIAGIFCLLLASHAWAQIRSSTITGSITDSGGALVPDAGISVINQETNVTSDTTSNNAGDFTVPYLPAGRYTLVVKKDGFQPQRRTDVVLGSSQSVRVDMSLALGSVQSVVEVKSDAVQLQTETSSVQGAVDKTVIANIPNVTHNPLLYATLQAGVTPRNAMQDTTSPNAFGIGYWSKFQYSAFSVNGGAAFTNDIQLDGLSVQGSAWNEAAVMPNPDALEEVRINTNNYAADQGRGQGIVSMITKSGTNQFHGGGGYTIRRDALNANTFENNLRGNPKGNFSVDQFSGHIGGPIIKDKLFFFASYEGLLHTAPAWWRLTVPTADERKGDFSKRLIADQNGNPIPGTIFDPYSAAQVGPNLYQRSPFPGNVIPNPNPYALKIYNSYPMPNATPTNQYGAGNFYTMKDQKYSRNSSNNRIDYRRGRHSIYGTGGLEQGSIHTPRAFGDDSPFYVIPSSAWTAEYNRDKDPYGAIGDTIVLSPTVVLDVRYGVNRINTDSVSGQNSSFDYNAFGVPANVQAIIPYPGVALDIQPSGLSPLGQGISQQKRERQTNHTLAGSMTKMSGRWSFKGGSEFRAYLSNYTDFQSASAQMNDGVNYTQQYADVWGGGVNSMNQLPQQNGMGPANLMTGASAYYVSPGFGTRLALAQKMFALYSQNDWRATNKLTINLGMRWELQPGPTERYNRISSIDLTAPNPYAGTGAFAFPGTNGYGRNLWNKHWRDFQPRIGAAYRVSDSFVVRAGFGRSYIPSNTGFFDGPFVYGSQGFAAYDQRRVYGTTPNGMPVGHFWDSNTVQIYQAAGAQQRPGLYGTAGYPFFERSSNIDGHVDQWNFFLEKSVKGSWMFAAGYVGSRGRNLSNSGMPFQGMQNIPDATLNTWRQGFVASNGTSNPATQQVRNPYQPATGDLIPFSGYLGGATMNLWQTMMPYPILGTDDTMQMTNGYSDYHAMQLRAAHAFSSGFSLQAHYTWSKALDNSYTNLQGGQSFSDNAGTGGWDLRNWDNNRALAVTDIPHRFLAVATYELPFGKGKAFELRNSILRSVAGNWVLGGVYTIQSGLPFSATGCDSAGSLNGRCNLNPNEPVEVPSNLQHWYDGKTSVSLPDGRTITPCADCFLKYNPDLFSGNVVQLPNGKYASDPYWFGSAARTYGFLRGPGRNNLDLTINRQFRIHERYTAEIVGNFTNALNHTQFVSSGFTASAGTVQTADPSHGVVPGMNSNINFGTMNLKTYDPRQVTFNFRLRF